MPPGLRPGMSSAMSHTMDGVLLYIFLCACSFRAAPSSGVRTRQRTGLQQPRPRQRWR